MYGSLGSHATCSRAIASTCEVVRLRSVDLQIGDLRIYIYILGGIQSSVVTNEC